MFKLWNYLQINITIKDKLLWQVTWTDTKIGYIVKKDIIIIIMTNFLFYNVPTTHKSGKQWPIKMTICIHWHLDVYSLCYPIMPHSPLTQWESLFCDFYYYISFQTRSYLIIIVVLNPLFIGKGLDCDGLDACNNSYDLWDHQCSISKTALECIALMKVLKYEQSHDRHLWTAELFTHPVCLINEFMRSEGRKSFPVQKSPHSHSRSVSIHSSLFDV